MSAPGRAARIALALIGIAQVIVGASYIARTSLEFEGDRVFVLWDDAMISMRYARNLAEGHGLVWNPGGERVQGYTNLGFTLAMSALHELPISSYRMALGVQVFELGALLAALLLAARIARLVTGQAWAGVGAALGLLLCAPHAIFALQGADTGPVTVLLLAAVAIAARAHARGEPIPTRSFVPLWIAMLVRPDASLFVAGAAFTLLVHSFLVPGPSAGATRRSAGLGMAGAAVVWTGLVGFSQLYYGEPLPNTYYLKATGAPIAKVLSLGFEQLATLGLRLLPASLAALMALWLAPRDASRWLLAGSTAVAAIYHVCVGGDWLPHYGSRHLVQVVPLWLTLAAIGIADGLARAARPAGRAAVPVLVAATAGITLLGSGGRVAREWLDPRTATLLYAENRGNFDRAQYLRTRTRPDTSVGVHWAGIGPYFAERRSIDMLGRSDRHIAHMQVDRFVPGHSKWDWDYIVEVRRPDVIDFASRGLDALPGFRAHYRIARIGPSAQLFVRAEAVDKLLDPGVRVLPIAHDDSP